MTEGSRVTVITSPSGRFNGKTGTVTGGQSVVRVVFDDGRSASFWHEDLKPATRSQSLAEDQPKGVGMSESTFNYTQERERAILLATEMPNGTTVDDWLGTAVTAVVVAESHLSALRSGTAGIAAESVLRMAADRAAQALDEICTVMDTLGYVHGYDKPCTFGIEQTHE